jgi:hypothetical protein
MSEHKGTLHALSTIAFIGPFELGRVRRLDSGTSAAAVDDLRDPGDTHLRSACYIDHDNSGSLAVLIAGWTEPGASGLRAA